MPSLLESDDALSDAELLRQLRGWRRRPRLQVLCVIDAVWSGHPADSYVGNGGFSPSASTGPITRQPARR